MTNLPPAIQRQMAEAEAIEQQLLAQTTPEVEPEVVEPAPIVEEPVVQPETQPDTVVPEIKAKPGREDDVDYWKGRANTLYGMNQQQASELQSLKSHLSELTQTVERLRSKPEPVAEAVPDKDAETFGEDLTEAIDRRAKQQAKSLVESEMADVRKYVKELEARLGVVDEQVAVSAQDRFIGKLSSLVPDYEAVNQDTGFLQWLGEVDPVYGVPRQAALDNAANSLDASRVAGIFNTYKQLTGKQVQEQQKHQVRKELERQVAPATSKANSAAKPADKVWTHAEYQAAFDVRRMKDTPADQLAALQAEADKAMYEGRVR